MVQKRTNESDEMQGEHDNEKKPGNKFFYQNKKQKSNPWSSFENDEFSTSSNGKQHVHSSNFNSLKSSELASVRNNSKFDLESVWSVRKNVPLSNSKQTSQLNLQTGNSFYSRHAGGLIGSHQSKTEQKLSTSDSGNTSSWQLKKPGYSYTSQGSLKRQADDDDEFDFNETKKGNFERDQSSSQRFDQTTHQNNTITNKGALSNLINPIRKGSARTQRAQKMNEAYLKSAGLGFYAPNDPFREKKNDEIE